MHNCDMTGVSGSLENFLLYVTGMVKKCVYFENVMYVSGIEREIKKLQICDMSRVYGRLEKCLLIAIFGGFTDSRYKNTSAHCKGPLVHLQTDSLTF